MSSRNRSLNLEPEPRTSKAEPATNEESPEALREGRVVREHVGRYTVSCTGNLVDCSLSSMLRKVLEYPTAHASSLRKRVIAVRGIRSASPVALGDFVAFQDSGDGTGMIYRVLDRRNKLSRKAAGTRPIEQILIANIDLAVLVFSIRQPDLHLEMLDRFLAICELEDISPLICLNKIDLAERTALKSVVEMYERIGYRVLALSALRGDGVDGVRQAVKAMVSVFYGPSGTGKTTLLNALQPGLGGRVMAVNKTTGRGRHTTSHGELFPLDGGGWVGDTPGLRELSLWDVDVNQVHYLFREMRPHIGSCRFRDCVHENEPGCSIKDAVASGKIDARRHEDYIRIRQRL